MPVKVERTVIVTEASGTKIVLNANDRLETETSCEFVCDGPRCAARQDKDAPTTFKWVEEEAKKTLDNLPDGFFRLIKLDTDPLDEKSGFLFCCPQCARDFLIYSYVPPKTSKERKAELKVTDEAQAAIDSQNPQMKLPFPEESAK